MKIEYRYEDMMQFQFVFKDGTHDYVDPVRLLEVTDSHSVQIFLISSVTWKINIAWMKGFMANMVKEK